VRCLADHAGELVSLDVTDLGWNAGTGGRCLTQQIDSDDEWHCVQAESPRPVIR
jgi:hypothetical protein